MAAQPKPKGRNKSVLPPGLDLLWGRRGGGTRGPKPGLSVDEIVAAAIRLADADGLAAVSMARVAAELGFTTMSLYRYVANKDELLQLMWNASAEGAADFVVKGKGWRKRILAWALLQREVIDEHPWITEMPMATPPMAPNSLIFVERGLETLDETGLPDADKLRIIGLISSYSLSEARMTHEARRAAETADADSAAWTFDSLVSELVDEGSYPRLHRIAAAGAGTGGTDEEDFRFGLERILDGVERMIERTTKGRKR